MAASKEAGKTRLEQERQKEERLERQKEERLERQKDIEEDTRFLRFLVVLVLVLAFVALVPWVLPLQG